MGWFSKGDDERCVHSLDPATCRGDLTDEQKRQLREQFWDDRRRDVAEVRDAWRGLFGGGAR